MIPQKDRIESAIRHIQTSVDIDPWAMELAVEALKAQDATDTNVGSNGDTIYRKAAIELIERMKPYHQDADDIAEMIANMPSAQPKTIRCKECKHQIKEWRDDKRLKDKGYWVYGCKVISDICGYWALFGQDDDFCSEAERKTDGTD